MKWHCMMAGDALTAELVSRTQKKGRGPRVVRGVRARAIAGQGYRQDTPNHQGAALDEHHQSRREHVRPQSADEACACPPIGGNYVWQSTRGSLPLGAKHTRDGWPLGALLTLSGAA
eukprot:7376409-Prymnesium_polylepis.2